MRLVPAVYRDQVRGQRFDLAAVAQPAGVHATHTGDLAGEPDNEVGGSAVVTEHHYVQVHAVDLGVEQGIVRKSGAWYTYQGDQLGQGKENARTFLRDNPDLANEIEKKIKEKLGVGPRLDADPAAGGGPGKAGNLSAVPDTGPSGPPGNGLASDPGVPLPGGVG